GVAEAHVVERLPAGELLVAGTQVDLRVARRPAVIVGVAPIGLDPGTVESVDDLPETAEVDRDQVVDLHAREPAHRLERALRAAVRVRRIDLVEERRLAGAANLDAHVTWEGEERDRVGCRIGAEEHERVGATRGARAIPLAVVVADHEGNGGLPWE